MQTHFRYLLILSVYLLPGLASGQQDTLLVQNGKVIEQNRYQDIDGSPYYFNDWVKGRVLRSDAMYLEDVFLNYNGFSHQLEARVGGQVYTLDKKWHLRADVVKAENSSMQGSHPDTIVFQLGVHRALADTYGAILYEGEYYTLVKDYDIGKADKGFNTVGSKIEIDRFRDLSVCYLLTGTELIPMKRHKKRIAEAFGDDERIRTYVAEQRLDVDDDRDLVTLVRYADGLKNK